MTTLNDLHQQALVTGFRILHRRMEELESQMARSTAPSPFRERVLDLSPTEIKVVQDYFARLRDTMAACLHEHGIPVEIQPTSLRWVLQTGIAFLQVDVDDLGPRRLRGYGPLDPAACQTLLRMQGELSRLVDRVAALLRQRSAADFPERLAHSSTDCPTAELLVALHAIVSRWQLVEFRPSLDSIAQRLESPRYEIAVFGRVNSGKSSLLNRVAGSAVLPVGVTPVTAVPTRLVRGTPPLALVQFAEMEPRSISLSDLTVYASEQGNPGNRRHVTAIEVRMPSPRLPDGVVLVDTPGIGSLAASGGAETLAYLPRCDLGVVLIDAAGTLTEQDLALLNALNRAGIPAQVLLSKADLLSPADRDQTLAYLRDQIQRELATELLVHAVSTVASEAALLDEWFAHEIEPLFEDHRRLVEQSLRRKTSLLRESVRAVLETMLARRRGQQGTADQAVDIKTARQLLDDADDEIADAEKRCREWSDRNGTLVEAILREAAQGLVRSVKGGAAQGKDALPNAVGAVLMQTGHAAQAVVQNLRNKLLRAVESLPHAVPMATIDAEPIRGFACRGLPSLELPPGLADCRGVPPWWLRLLPRMAMRVTRQRIRRRCEMQLAEHIQLCSAHLRAWLGDSLRELSERYQTQAEVLREQLRRLTRPVPIGNTEAETDELRHAIEQLDPAGTSSLPT